MLWLAQLALIHLPARRRLACVRELLQAAAEISSSPPRSARAVHPALPLVDAAALPALLLLLVTSLAATLEEQLRPPTPAALSRALRTLDTAAALSTRTLRALLSLALPPSATGVLCAACAALSVAPGGRVGLKLHVSRGAFAVPPSGKSHHGPRYRHNKVHFKCQGIVAGKVRRTYNYRTSERTVVPATVPVPEPRPTSGPLSGIRKPKKKKRRTG